MPQVPSEILFPLQASLEQWSDNRTVHVDDVERWTMFGVYLTSVLPQFSQHVKGFSFRQKRGQWLLAIKVREDDTPLVVFVTAETPTACVHRFWDLWEEDRLTWVRDKYP